MSLLSTKKFCYLQNLWQKEVSGITNHLIRMAT